MSYLIFGVVIGVFILTMSAGEVFAGLLSDAGTIVLLKALKVASMIAIISLPLYWSATKKIHIKIFVPFFIVFLAFYGVVLSPSIEDEISKLEAQENIENTEHTLNEHAEEQENRLDKE